MQMHAMSAHLACFDGSLPWSVICVIDVTEGAALSFQHHAYQGNAIEELNNIDDLFSVKIVMWFEGFQVSGGECNGDVGLLSGDRGDAAGIADFLMLLQLTFS